MAIIVTEENCIHVNDALIPKNGSTVSLMVNGVRLKGGWGIMDILVDGSTIDGEDVSSANELFEYFKANSFNDGGGDGTVGVAGITGLEAGNFIIGGDEGNEQRKIRAADLGMTVGGQMIARAGSGGGFTYYFAAVNPGNSNVVVRTPTGQGKFNAAVNSDEAVVLSQFQGIVNDTLSNSETSVTLQALYADAVVGTTVTAPTALTEYTKYSVGLWKKRTIEAI